MSTQKPVMYPDRDMWQHVERYLIDGVWKVVQEGQVDAFNFSLLMPNVGAVVLCRRQSKNLKIYQREYHLDEFERVLFDHTYRNNRFRNQGWYVWCLRDVKDYSMVKRPTLRAQLFVEESYQKIRPELNLEQDYQSPAVTKAFAPTVLDAPSVRVLNCTGQTVAMDSLTDNTFMVEGEGTFVGPVEINITDPNRATRSKIIQTEGLMRSYRTWKHPIKKIIPGTYKIQVKSVDGKVQHSETVKFTKPQLELITIHPLQANPPAPSTWDDMLGLATATWHGVESFGDSIYLGTKVVADFSGLDFSAQYQDAATGIRLIEFLIKVAKISVHADNPVTRIIEIVLKEYYEQFPECAIERLSHDVLKGAGYATGRYILAGKIAKAIATRIANKVLESTVFKELEQKVATGGVSAETGVGASVTILLSASVIEKSKEAAQNLQQESPQLYQTLLDQKLLGGYFLVEHPLKHYINGILAYNKSHEEFEGQAKQRYCQ